MGRILSRYDCPDNNDGFSLVVKLGVFPKFRKSFLIPTIMTDEWNGRVNTRHFDHWKRASFCGNLPRFATHTEFIVGYLQKNEYFLPGNRVDLLSP